MSRVSPLMKVRRLSPNRQESRISRKSLAETEQISEESENSEESEISHVSESNEQLDEQGKKLLDVQSIRALLTVRKSTQTEELSPAMDIPVTTENLSALLPPLSQKQSRKALGRSNIQQNESILAVSENSLDLNSSGQKDFASRSSGPIKSTLEFIPDQTREHQAPKEEKKEGDACKIWRPIGRMPD